MKRSIMAALCAIVLFGAAIVACTTPSALPGPTPTTAPGTPTLLATPGQQVETPVVSMSDLVDRLTATVEEVGEEAQVGEQPETILFSSAIEARVITISDPVLAEEIHIYRFASNDEASNAATTVDPNAATIGGVPLNWQLRPHFYHNEQYIVVYVGINEDLRTAMGDELGDPFAEGTG